MLTNRLKINSDKTEFMVITTPHYQTTYQALQPAVCVGGVRVHAVPSLRNLGVTMDSTMNMHAQIQSVKNIMFHHLRTISSIRRFLDKDTCVKAVLSLVMSRVDHCNSLLVGQSVAALRGLQLAQTYAARLVMGRRWRDHVTSALRALHWLPIHQRVRYKVLCLLYKTMYTGEAPAYMGSMVNRYTPDRTLRSTTTTVRLVVPCTRLSCVGRCFSVSAPAGWNALPPHFHHCRTLNSFKTGLKTHLFREHFS